MWYVPNHAGQEWHSSRVTVSSPFPFVSGHPLARLPCKRIKFHASALPRFAIARITRDPEIWIVVNFTFPIFPVTRKRKGNRGNRN